MTTNKGEPMFKKILAAAAVVTAVVYISAIGWMTSAGAAGVAKVQVQCSGANGYSIAQINLDASGAPFVKFVFTIVAGGLTQTVTFHENNQTDPSLDWWSDSALRYAEIGEITISWEEFDGGNLVVASSGPVIYTVSSCDLAVDDFGSTSTSIPPTTIHVIGEPLGPPTSVQPVVTAPAAEPIGCCAEDTAVVQATVAAATAIATGPAPTLPRTGASALVIGGAVAGSVALGFGIGALVVARRPK